LDIPRCAAVLYYYVRIAGMNNIAGGAMTDKNEEEAIKNFEAVREGMTAEQVEANETIFREFMLPILVDLEKAIARQTEENGLVLPEQVMKDLAFRFSEALILAWEKHSEGRMPKYFRKGDEL
jgi:hypothetical protein